MKSNALISIFGDILLALLLSTAQVWSFGQHDKPRIAGMDKRTDRLPALQLTPTRQQAQAQLQGRISFCAIDYDPITGAPAWIHSSQGYLTGPTNENETIPKTAQALPSPANDDLHRPVTRFLDENSALFEHNAQVLMTNAIITREFVTAHNGMRTLVWQQQLDGIPVFEGFLVGHITKRGELVNLSSYFLPDIAGASGLAASNRLNLERTPPISGRQSLVNALTNIGETITVDGVAQTTAAPAGPERPQRFTTAPVQGEARASLVWLPMNRSTVRLCWQVEFVNRSSMEGFRTLVDAVSGEVLVRQNRTFYYTDASYRVFTGDSPSPGTPGLAAPGVNQATDLTTPGIEYLDRQLVTLPALSGNASPEGWIPDGGNTTVGNNVEATSFRKWHALFGGDADPPPQGSPSRVFDFGLNLNNDPSQYTSASVVNLFYRCNWSMTGSTSSDSQKQPATSRRIILDVAVNRVIPLSPILR